MNGMYLTNSCFIGIGSVYSILMIGLLLDMEYGSLKFVASSSCSTGVYLKYKKKRLIIII